MSSKGSCRIPARLRFRKHFVVSTETYRGIPCWDWQGMKGRDGYPQFMGPDQKTVPAMRWIYQEMYSPLDIDEVPDHLCRRIVCVNPQHAERVTQTENKRRGVGWAGRNAQKTHCLRGHPLSGDNLRMVPKGRVCRACQTIYKREYRKRKRAS